MEALFILWIAAAGAPASEAYPLWAIEGQANCETVAEILSLNSDAEVLSCRPEGESFTWD